MLEYYLQDMVGTEVPIAPFAKATPTNILAETLKIYRYDQLRQVNHYDYVAANGKHLCRTKTCTRSCEYESEYVRNKKGILAKVITTHTNGKREVHSRRKWMKYEDTFFDGYLTCRYYPNAKLNKTFKFTENNCVYSEVIDLQENEVTQYWEQYDWLGRICYQLYIRHEKDNPIEIYEYETLHCFYENENDKDSHMSHIVGMINTRGWVRSFREEFSDYDDHDNWRTKHRYELSHDVDAEEQLKHIMRREIAYIPEELQKVEDAYGEAAFLINLDEYSDKPEEGDYPF